MLFSKTKSRSNIIFNLLIFSLVLIFPSLSVADSACDSLKGNWYGEWITPYCYRLGKIHAFQFQDSVRLEFELAPGKKINPGDICSGQINVIFQGSCHKGRLALQTNGEHVIGAVTKEELRLSIANDSNYHGKFQKQ